MKILRLRLCNLTSLRDHNAVDFTLPPLSTSGLFAITGPTGAGKSTLLDAITLALYGRVARYGSTPSPESVMSRHTGECSVEVEFACAAGTFRSVWQLQRARKKSTGNVQAPKRRIIALPGETVIAESTRDADAKIVELTGLDYERFLRSVLLAQGDFAAFLKAGPKERTELLQQVTGTAIYQEISQAAFRRAADAELVHAELLRSHQAVPVLSAGERSRHETSSGVHTARVVTLTTTLQALAKRLSEAERWSEIERATQQLRADEAAYAANHLAAAADLARLSQHERAAPFVPDLTTLERLAVDLTADQAAWRAMENRIPELDRCVIVAEQAVHQAQAAFATELQRQQGLRELWTRVAALDQTLATQREAQRQLDEQLGTLQKNIAAQRVALDQATAQKQEASTTHAAALHWLRENARDATLAGQLADIQSAQARHATTTSALLQAQTAFRKLGADAELYAAAGREIETVKRPPIERELAGRAAAVADAQRRLAEFSEGFSAAELDTRRDQARERRVVLEQLIADATRLKTLGSELARGRSETEQATAHSIRAEATRKGLEERHTQLARLLQARSLALQFAEKVQSLESHRAELKDDTPCPLCGALHHPYTQAAQTAAAEMAALRHEVATTTEEWTTAQRELTAAEKHCASLEADHKRLLTHQTQRGDEYTALQRDWNTRAELHGLANTFAEALPLRDALTAAAADESRRQAQIVSVRAAQQSLEQAKQQLQGLQNERDRLNHEAAKHAALVAQARAQMAAAEANLKEQERQALRENALVTQLVSPFTASPDEFADFSTLLDTLKRRAAAFTRQTTEAERWQALANAHEAKISALQAQLTTSENAARELQLKLAGATTEVTRTEAERFNLFGARTVAAAQEEAERAQAHARTVAEVAQTALVQHRQNQTTARQERDRLATAITTRTTEHQTISERLRTEAEAAGFANVARLREARLEAAEARTLTLRRQTLDDRRVTLAAQSAALQQQRVSLPDTAGADAAQKGGLVAEQATLETERSALQATLGEIRAVLKNDDEQLARQQAFATQIDAAHHEFVRWNRLRGLIGSADGSMFARFAQGLTLERLAVLANLHLGQLNPRYSIRRADGEAGDLELEIVDHYQADVARPMRSLSGGESFLVSLALALGLSELASGRTTIESVFIDEGFGSLDADTLETAMSALESLQARGKTIGVISHVPAMQERIPAQIRVSKESGGWSRIRIVG